jgi:hypothetical protein
MKYVAEAEVRTNNAAKYAAQLGKHWAHNLTVKQDGDSYQITFPKDARGASWPGDAIATLKPQDGILLCRIEATADGQREGLKTAIARHVDRFAYREAPLTFNWTGIEK